MALVQMFKMPFRTNHFNANQRVWVLTVHGENALVMGRYRGRGRYVRAHVDWSSQAKTAPIIKQIEVADAFANRHRLWHIGKPYEQQP